MYCWCSRWVGNSPTRAVRSTPTVSYTCNVAAVSLVLLAASGALGADFVGNKAWAPCHAAIYRPMDRPFPLTRRSRNQTGLVMISEWGLNS
jgi:hypothetical protein